MYIYQQIRPRLFTDEGQRMFLRIRDFVHKTLNIAGAVRMQEAIASAGGGCSWTMLACVDRMVELGEISEITQSVETPAQYRVFVDAKGSGKPC